ncbi:hypothetical protein Undi14_02350 [Undibacterium sp. 14-3-2]|uniref:hypothetical protein n=1 Tax=Undibacterium sp. 14-3-2 TaxID=2800129 RepID=UPI001908F8D1|nr:hypothetical protein [Undibacterium sp. 14-3-2]MBK1888857.1 hypothetical protein [Undibacterium sp. 14-3-2]
MSLLGFSCKVAAQTQVKVHQPDKTNLLASGGTEVSESQANQASTEVLVAH